MNKYTKGAVLAASVALLVGTMSSAAAASTSIGVNFAGRNPAQDVAPTDVTGATGMTQSHWNNIDHGDNPKGHSLLLGDSTGAFTAVSLIYDCNDSWESDGAHGTSASADENLMWGCIKQQNAGTACHLTFTNMAAGTYDVVVYMAVNNDNVNLNVNVGNKTYYVVEQHKFDDAWHIGTSTDPANYDTGDAGTGCNYVKFTGATVGADGLLTIAATYVSGGDGLGICAVQVFSANGFPLNQSLPNILSDPADNIVVDGQTASFSVTVDGRQLGFGPASVPVPDVTFESKLQSMKASSRVPPTPR